MTEPLPTESPNPADDRLTLTDLVEVRGGEEIKGGKFRPEYTR